MTLSPEILKRIQHQVRGGLRTMGEGRDINIELTQTLENFGSFEYKTVKFLVGPACCEVEAEKFRRWSTDFAADSITNALIGKLQT